MNLILFDYPAFRNQLLPFTYTRPVANLRCGIFTINEKWELLSGHRASYLTYDYLTAKFSTHYDKEQLYINGSVCPDASLIQTLQELPSETVLMYGATPIALKTKYNYKLRELVSAFENLEARQTYTGTLVLIQKATDIFTENGGQIRSDFVWIQKHKKSQPITDEHTRVYGLHNIFLEEGVVLRANVLNAEQGPIYIGKGAELQEGAVVRGPFALGAYSVVNMGAKIRPDVSVGPYCKVGGEISNSVFYAYSNKGHDGFVGNSVIGEWCNIGADSNTSNLKNNYSEVKLWSYTTQQFENSGRMFCGTLMGDHVKSGINTMFNTGTTIGVNANIFGGGFPAKFIPSFAWGGSEGDSTKYRFDKALEVAQRVMERRNMQLTEAEVAILKWVYENGI